VRASYRFGLGLALGLCQCGSEGFFEVISPAAPGSVLTSCGEATAAPVSAVEIGRSTSLPLGSAGAFVPLVDGDTVRVEVGFQGSPMLVVALRITGAGAQTCVQQRIDVVDEGGDRVSYNALAQRFTPVADGTAVTQAIFLPGEYASGTVTVRVALGGVTLARRLQVVR